MNIGAQTEAPLAWIDRFRLLLDHMQAQLFIVALESCFMARNFIGIFIVKSEMLYRQSNFLCGNIVIPAEKQFEEITY